MSKISYISSCFVKFKESLRNDFEIAHIFIPREELSQNVREWLQDNLRLAKIKLNFNVDNSIKDRKSRQESE